jgi:serine/threonine protein kinase
VATPKTLGDRYVLLKQIASGGMSSGVWEAIDTQDPESKKVAVKLLDADKDLRRLNSLSFETEVEAYTRLNHKHVLRIFDHGTTAELQRYIVMEWMPVDLERYRDERPDLFSTWDSFADAFAFPMLEALSHCHSQGVAHRDIKPANILISEAGTPVLADFGLSKLRYLLQPRQTLGTFSSPPFTPPETDDGSFTYSRDVYAFAATCIWALSGRLPSNQAELHDCLKELVISDHVRGELQCCISKDPSIRPETAAVALERLSAVRARLVASQNLVNRRKIGVRLMPNAQKHLESLLGVEPGRPMATVKAFLMADLNDSPVIERRIRNFGLPTEELVPDCYQVWGATFLYELMVPASTATNTQLFLITAVSEVRESTLSKKRETCMPLRVDFHVDGAPGCEPAMDAAELFEEWVHEFDAEQRKLQFESKKHEMLVLWENLLNAQEQWELQRFGVINYTLIESRGVLIRVHTGLSDVTLPIDSTWYLKGADRSIRCRLIDQHGPVLTFNTNRPVNPEQSGTLERSKGDFSTILTRQRMAINAVAEDRTLSKSLPEILLNPARCLPPNIKRGDNPFENALEASLSSTDLFLVTGPPGTGKTTLIQRTVDRYLKTNPDHRVLICAQTNVAIDNALERIGEATGYSAVRVGGYRNSGSSAVAKFSLEHQMQEWAERIELNTTEWRRQKAIESGVVVQEIELGSILLKIAIGRQALSSTESELRQQRDQRKALLQDLKDKNAAIGTVDDRPGRIEEFDEHIEVLEDRVTRIKQDLNNDEKRLRQRASKQDAEMYLAMKAEELKEWADDYVAQTPQAANAFELLRLQAEWFERLSVPEKDDSLFSAFCDTCSIVAATCIGLESLPGINKIQFDLCILDEASKASPSESLVPLVRSKRAVFVGDIKQLSPYQSDFLHDRELMEHFQIPTDYRPSSLFESLLGRVPSGCTETLELQRRMVPEIGQLVSDVFYGGILKSEERESNAHLLRAFGKPVVWMSTSQIFERSEESAGRSIVNHLEKDLVLESVLKITSALADVDLEQEFPKGFRILVLSGYSAQVKLIQDELKTVHIPIGISIEVATIDAVQGREAEVVLFSLVRSNDFRSEGFLVDEKRINVAVSRAKDILCIIGDAAFIDSNSGNTPLKEVLRYMRYNPQSCVVENVSLK